MRGYTRKGKETLLRYAEKNPGLMLDPESQQLGGLLERYSGALIRVVPASTTYASDTSGAVTRNRTLDILITKQALYLLSYDGLIRVVSRRLST